jgi:hypothetical protein
MSDRNKVFPDAGDLWDRYESLKRQDSGINGNNRALMLNNYVRKPWKVRVGKRNGDYRTDPNFGEFRFKVESVINMLVSACVERQNWFRIVPKNAPIGEQKSLSDKITNAFHRYFIRTWEDRFLDEVYAAYDMTMFGKAVEHWPSIGCIYTENVPESRVFPDTNAGMNPRKWGYVFIEKDYSVFDLRCIYEDDDEVEMEGWDREYLKEILDNPSQYSETPEERKGRMEEVFEGGSSNVDHKIVLVHAYIKDNNKPDKDGDIKKVSRYIFPAVYKKTKAGEYEDARGSLKFLSQKRGYCECISNVVAVRSFNISRSYWNINSFARQIYLSTAFYDKVTASIIRAAKKAMTLFIKAQNRDQVEKLINQHDGEVVIVDPDVTFENVKVQNDIRQMIEVVRSVMVQTEQGMSIGQAPGSQNVKGYAITAQEASIRAQREGEKEALNIKLLIAGDCRLYKEVYRRAMLGLDEDHKESLSSFKEEMKSLGVDAKYYNPKNVHFIPNLFGAASKSVRIGDAQGVLQALMFKPSTPQEERAQRDLVAAYVGEDNVMDYIQPIEMPDPAIVKAGGENEDLDNPMVNPKNVPVLPSDKHLIELPVHIADYEDKLTKASRLIEMSGQQPNPVKQYLLVHTAAQLIVAQDNKGAHIQAHIQASANSKMNEKALEPLVAKFRQLQSQQDQLTDASQKLINQLDQALSQSDINSEELRYRKAMHDMEIEFKKTLNDIDIAKAIQKKEHMEETREIKKDADHTKIAQDLVKKESQNQLEIQKKEAELAMKERERQLKNQQSQTSETQ